GSSANVVTGHEFASNTKGSNYEVSYKPGKLVVTDDNVDPGKVITKTHASDAYKLGDEVTFVIEAKNIYASAKDMTFTELPGVKLAKSEFKDVAPGAIVSTTARYTITEDDILAGSFVNTVTVSFGDKAYAADDTVDVVEVNPELDVTKNTVSAPANGSAYQLGEIITYKTTVTNTGNVTLRGIALTDDNADDLANESIDVLKPGDFKTFEASHKVTEADVIAGAVENNASATTKAPNQDEPVQSTLGHTEDAAGPSNPHLTIEKTTTTSPKNGVSYELDETIKYQVTVTNTGNLTLSNVALTDDNADDLDVKEVGTLAPGASKTFKASHKVTEADIQSGSVVNNATATATSPDPNKEVTVVPGQATDPTDAPNAHVTITKEAEQNGTAENGAFKLGETIHYTITVTNTGNQTAKNIKVSDDNANNFGTKTIESLAPGKSKTFKATHTVTESDILAGTVVNVATGESDTDVPVTPGTDEKKTEAVDATLAVSKVANAPANGEAYQLGEEVTYKITITNKGNVSYSNVKVEDAQTGLSETLDALAVGESHEFTTTHVITEGDIAAGSYTNVVTAEADAIVDEAGTTYVPRATDDETIGANTDNPIVDPSAKLRLEKTVSNMGQGTGENGAFALGDVIKYQITVTNTGNLTVKDFVISDNNADGFTPVNVGALAPGASYTVAAQHVVTSDDILAGSVFNVATATGGNTTDPDTKPEPGKDQVDTPVASVDVPLVVTKTASEPADGVAFKVGEKVNYSISVTNAGNVPYENVKVTDVKTGLDKTIAELGVGQTREFTTSHVITEADVVAGSYKNVATAKADSITDPKTGEEKVPAGEASETIGANTNKPIEASAPSIEVSKSSNAAKLHDDGLLVEGDVVTYKVTVTNTGNLTLTNVKLTDQLAGAQLANGETDTIASLAPGASATVKYRYTVTQADVVAGHVHNEATAKADTPDPAKPTVEPKAPGVTDDPTEATKPSLHIDKTDNGASKVPVGGTINYTLTVTNNGNVDLSDVVVTDQLTGLNHQIGNLAKGASVKVLTSYMVVEGDVVNGFVHNVATGSAKSPDNKDVKVIPGEATTTTEDMNAAIELEKTAASGVYGAGDKITYTITVTNVGNVTITGVQTEDRMTGLSEQTTLAPGESATYTTDYVVTDADLKAGKIDNTATSKGLDPKGGEVAASDTETVTNDPQVNPENPDKPSLKRDFKVTGPVDVVYNGYSQYQKPIVKDGEKVLTEGVDYTLEPSADTTNVGKVTIRVMGKGNYTGEVECSYLITPASLVITTGSANKRYDGKALTNKSLTIAGLQGEDTVIAKTTGTQTKVGSSTNGYSIDWGTTNPGNYLITESLGTLTVRPAKAPAPDPTPGSTTPTPAPGPGNDNNPGGQGTNPGNEGNGTDNGSQPQPGNGDSGEKIYDSENPLGNAHPECWVHYYMIICMIITALYGVGVWARRGNYTRKLKKDMDDVMGDGDGMDSPAATQPTTKPAGMEA
ncbi:MAG: hypothetical protein Q4F23_01145, partial [Coriobacteriia bacterium]|nr:hypothetical protein [Coriobacteriia bacterium]